MRRQALYSALGAMLLAGTVAQTAELKPFTASYSVAWRGITAGAATVSLTQPTPDQWLYTSQVVARGVFRAVMPGQISQRSELRLQHDGIQPLHYTVSGPERARPQELTFNWTTLRVAGTAGDKTVDAAIEPGTQDDLSVQVALMHELNQGRTPSGFRIFNDRGLREYDYRREGTATLETALGSIETVIYHSGRAGSDRVTRYWCAPSLGYLPLQVQQKRGERVEVTMSIQKLQRD